MSRWLSILLLAALLLLGGGWLLWYFAYGVELQPPARVPLSGLSGPVEIGWHDDGVVAVTAGSEADAYAGLGYTHGLTRAWSISLWRQAALGRQSEWFGDGLLEIDRFTRRLGFAALAQEAYRALPEEDRALLEAYARGVNAALQARQVRLSEELSLLDLQPDPWLPWHTLAVERLFAWLAAPLPDSVAVTGTDGRAFLQADDALREYLHLHGFEHSTAWALQDSAGTQLFQRHVYGASALPFYQEVRLQWPEHSVTGATLPGTPFFPAGKTEGRAWALLPTGTVQFTWTVQDTAAGNVRYERLSSYDGTEHLLTVRRTLEALQFEPPPKPPVPDSLLARADSTDSLRADPLRTAPGSPAPGTAARPAQALPQRRTGTATAGAPLPPDSLQVPLDSTWALSWAGFSPVTDWAAWRALLRGEPAAFQLLRGTGLAMDPDGTLQVLGQPAVVRRLARGVVVGNTPWTHYVAADLDSLLQDTRPLPQARQWAGDFRSVWAELLAPAMIASVDSIPNRTEAVEEALTYLRNWDFAYDRPSIAASIFDTWVSRYREEAGYLPHRVIPDTLFFENLRRYQFLEEAVHRLTQRFGDDLSQWRWENVYPDTRYFPVWSADSLLERRAGLITRTRYAPIRLPGLGHPSTLAWGSSPILDERAHPAAWEAWISTDAWDQLFARRRLIDTETFLGRYRTSSRVPPPVSLEPGEAARHRTVLSPAL